MAVITPVLQARVPPRGDGLIWWWFISVWWQNEKMIWETSHTVAFKQPEPRTLRCAQIHETGDIPTAKSLKFGMFCHPVLVIFVHLSSVKDSRAQFTGSSPALFFCHLQEKIQRQQVVSFSLMFFLLWNSAAFYVTSSFDNVFESMCHWEDREAETCCCAHAGRGGPLVGLFAVRSL